MTINSNSLPPPTLAEPWEIWKHLLPSFDGKRRKRLNRNVSVHPSFAAAYEKQRRRSQPVKVVKHNIRRYTNHDHEDQDPLRCRAVSSATR